MNVKLSDSSKVIDEAVAIIKKGGLVISPTRTNYCVICDPMNEEAIKKVFHAKKRTKFGPLSLNISSVSEVNKYVYFPTNFDMNCLIELWPGELSIIFKKGYPFPELLTMGANTIAVSFQGQSVLHQILESYKGPLASTSANISGQGDIFIDLEKSIEDIGEKVDLIIDSGVPSPALSVNGHNRSNTIIDLTFDIPFLVREGIVPTEKIKKVIPNLNEDMATYKYLLEKGVTQKYKTIMDILSVEDIEH
ncbi:MAG TPA: threonylcarbamoyl-AMP synthase [Bacillales bacterium]|nr:threonylcarbamoyl-AMP synthase [Bacillales bacterium]